jgi:CHAT domain-containing protein
MLIHSDSIFACSQNPTSGIDKLTRVFWCPTGPFSFLPIHAAGLYDTAEAGIKLSDFVISSYLPTLSSLASSPQNSFGDLSSKLRLLVVPQPPTDGLNPLFSVKHEIDSITELCKKSPLVTLQNSEGTVEDVTETLKNTDWVHFACHGIQDPKKPLDSGLCLANNRRLKFSDIMQLSRPKGGLAFLSACQTAQGDSDETLSEECVHLAAGMLLAGYGSVIETMWAMREKDPKVARDVYEHLFRDASQVPDSTEAAAALHCAIQKLRNSGAPFSSWVPFIHFGR